jgi:hypothetical protein
MQMSAITHNNASLKQLKCGVGSIESDTNQIESQLALVYMAMYSPSHLLGWQPATPCHLQLEKKVQLRWPSSSLDAERYSSLKPRQIPTLSKRPSPSICVVSSSKS